MARERKTDDAGPDRSKRSESDKSLMENFLRAADGYSDDEVADASGINRESIRQYRNDDWVRLYDSTRRKMERYIGARPPEGAASYAEGMRVAAEKMEATLSEIRALLERHEAEDAKGLLKRSDSAARGESRDAG